MEWGGIFFSKCPDTLSFKGQKSKNYAEKRKGAKEAEEPGTDRGHTAVCPYSTVMRSCHHGLCSPPRADRGGVRLCRFTIFWTLRFGASFWSVGSALGLLGLFCNLPWSSIRPSNLFFSPITWLNICKSEIKNSEQTKDKRNRRNRGVNHQIKYINPQEWVLNTQLIHAYITIITAYTNFYRIFRWL